jgi:hypothetical protein
MKRMIALFVCVCSVMALAAMAVPASAANLLVNGDFETGSLSPWVAVAGLGPNATVTVQSGVNGPTLAGTNAAFLNNQAEANGLTMAQTTANGTAVPGTVFYAFDLKVGTAANGGVFFVEIFAQNSVGAVIGNAGLLGNYSPAGWTHYSGSFNAPANTDHLTIQFEAPTGAVTGSVSSMSVDNVDLEQSNPVPTTSTSWGRIKSLYR